MQLLTKFLTSSLFALSASLSHAEEDSLVSSTQRAHGLEAWWGKEVMQVDAEMIFGGNTVVEGTFTYEAHGPRARYDRADGASIIFDGKTAWVTPSTAKAPMGRFHVLTWPWFVMAPFKMQGEGITLSEHGIREVEGEPYETVKQTFASGMGDAPDDWYRFFINKETNQIDAMSYIVTYAKDFEKANKKPSIIRYFDYTDEGGPVVATRYEFWYWDPERRTNVGDAPKGVGSISNIRYIASADADFSVPDDATELKLPGE